MKGTKTKKALLLLGSLFTVLSMVGCSLLGGVSELSDESAQKDFLKEASEEFGKQEAYKMELQGKILGDAESKATLKVKGDDMEMVMEAEGQEIGMINLGDYSYMKIGDSKWIKMKKEDASQAGASSLNPEDLEEEMFQYDEEEWGDKVKYEGLEEVDGVKCHKYSRKDGDNVDYVWFDGKTKLMKKYEREGEGSATMTYDDVTIEEPSDYEDLTDMSDEEKGKKMPELMGGGM